MAGTDGGGDMDDLIDELFNDYDSDEEGKARQGAAAAAPAAPAASAVPPAAGASGGDGTAASSSAPPLAAEEDLFGDFSEEGSEAGAPGGKAKRPASGAAHGERPAKAGRRMDAKSFFEIEAEEAGAGSGDEDEEGLEDLIDDAGVDSSARGRAKLRSELQRAARERELDEVQAEMDARGPEVGARRVFGGSFLDRLEERYRDAYDEKGEGAPRSPGERSLIEGGPAQTNTHVVPAPTDPKIWCCKTFGPENTLCISLMRKASECFSKGIQVPIFSAFFSPHLRGYIYIEAFREPDIRAFIKGIRGISPWSITVVPVAQMPLVFQASVTSSSEKKILKVGDWVRVKKRPQLYEGDLGQVDDVRDEEITVKLKPRIEYQIEAGGKATDKGSRDAKKRATPRWFNASDCEAAGMMVSKLERQTAQGRQWFYMVNEEFYRDGFLYKILKAAQLITGMEVRPQERELQDWRLAPPPSRATVPPEGLKGPKVEPGDDRKLMPPPSSLPKKVAQVELVEGDLVVVNAGELVNLKGRVVKAIFQAKTVTVRPLGVGEGTPDLNLAVATLCKYFEVGDYVKILEGKHAGDTGYVMKLDFGRGPKWNRETVARVLSASITAEHKVPVQSLRLTAQRADAVVEIKKGEFKVGHLVALSGRGGNSRGVIIRIELGVRATVLAEDGQRLDVALSELTPTKESRMSRDVWTSDRKGDKLRINCVVKAPRSMSKAAPIRAQILYIVNDMCFMRAEEGLCGDKAFLVASGKKCELVYDKGLDRELDLNAKGRKPDPKVEEAPTQQGMLQYGIQMASKTDWLKPWFKEMMGMPEDSDNVTRKGASIRITDGGYKGLRGEVRDFLGDKVRVSLLAKPKLVTIDMSKIAPDDYYNVKREFKPRFNTAGAPQPLAAPGTPIDEDAIVLHAGASDDESMPVGSASMPVLTTSTEGRALRDGHSAASSDEGDIKSALVKNWRKLPEEDQPLNDDNSWNPMFLMPKRLKDGSVWDEERSSSELPAITASGGPSAPSPSTSTPTRHVEGGTSTPRPEGAAAAPRRPGMATPPTADMSTPPTAQSPGVAGAARAASPRSARGSARGAGGASGAPSAENSPAAAGEDPEAPRLPLKKRSRVSRIPSEPGSPTPHLAAGESQRASPIANPTGADPEALRRRHRSQDRGWLAVGIGVKFTRLSLPCAGWVVKMKDGSEMLTVVPATAAVGDIAVTYTLSTNQLSPWLCDSRGEGAAVLSGPRRGARGKLVGVDRDKAYFRPDDSKPGPSRISTLTFSAVAGSGMILLERSVLVKYNREWEAAIKEGRATSGPVSVEEDAAVEVSAKASAKAASSAASAASVDLEARSPAIDVEEAAADGAARREETPGGVRITGIQAPWGDSPLSVGEQTPAALLVLETPEQILAKGETSVKPGLTPVQYTPMPFDAAHSGNATPMLPQTGGYDTPYEAKVKVGGGSTPLTPLPPGMVAAGSQTPVPTLPGAKGEEGAGTPQTKHEVKAKLEGTPLAPGDVTPLVHTAGSGASDVSHAHGMPLGQRALFAPGDVTPPVPTAFSASSAGGGHAHTAGDVTPLVPTFTLASASSSVAGGGSAGDVTPNVHAAGAGEGGGGEEVDL